MAKKNEYRMAIKIAGEIEKSLYNCTDLTRKELNKIAREAAYASSQTKGAIQNGIEETTPFFKGLEKAGIKAFRAVSAAAVGASTAVMGIGVATASMGMEFESAFAGVKKTTEATAQEYAQMRQEVIAMTREIPAAGTEISAVAEAAGQLGIEKENLLAFTRTMIDLGESTNLSSEEAASALAKFANITNMDAGNYSKLGSVIVDLGNNFATTEADIVDMATKMASAGELAGFTEPQIMAMAAAMSSVGIEAEAGGSAMSKIIKKVQVAVETGNKSLNQYAKVAGMSASEFKEVFQRNGLEAVAAFIGGLNDIKRNGKSATVILDEMGLTEVRLSNTLTSLANADELMLNAVVTANDAWEENTALAKEAGMRYETTESKLAIMRNGFTEMGIEISDQFNNPLRDGIDIVTELVHEATAEIKGSNVIHDLAQDVVERLPTAVRIMEEMAVATGNLAGHALSVGGWMMDHQKLMISTLTGAGAAVGIHKTARGVTALAKALKSLKSLGPGTLPVLGIAGGVAAVAGIGSYLYQLDKEMTQNNLEEHFGGIALSLEEIDNAARLIVGSGNLDKMDEMLSAGITSENLMRSMQDAMDGIGKKEWELGIGLSFSEEDKEDYASDVQQYVETAQEFVNSQGYTVHLSAELLLDGLDGTESIMDKNDKFYRQLEEHIGWLGDKTSSIISNALEKGLEIDQEEIDKALSDIQKLTDAISDAEMDAKLDRIKQEFSGADLDKDSAQALMQKISEYQGEIDKAALDAYEKNMATLNARKSLGEVSGEEYNAEKENLQKALDRKREEGMANTYGFMYSTILDAYQEELGDSGFLQEKIDKKIGQWMGNIEDSNGNDFTLWQAVNDLAADTDLLDKRDKKGLAVLWEDMSGQYGAMQELWQDYMADGGEAPQELKEAMQKASMIGMLAGDENAAKNLLGIAINENKGYQEVVKGIYQESGAPPPDMIASAAGIEIIPEEDENIGKKLAEQRVWLEKEVQSQFDGGIDVTVDLNYGFNGSWYPGRKQKAGPGISFARNDIDNNADGGIITRPTISWLAEGGYPEAVIPLDGSQNATNLWKQAGEMLGVPDNEKSQFSRLLGQIKEDSGSGAGSSINRAMDDSGEGNRFSYNPTYNFYGDAPSKKDLDEHVEDSFEKWEKMMNRWIRNNQRFSFS